MSRIRTALKNKNKVEKTRKARRRSEMKSLRDTSAFKARLYDELHHLEVILGDPNVDAVLIEVPDRFMSQFSVAIYSEDLAGYDVTQHEDSYNKFLIRRKFISF